MKKILTIILVLFAGYIHAQQITYTPMNAAGYRFKYFISDSGHTIPFKDTTLDRGTTRPGSLVCFTGDSAVYWYNGLMWKPIGSNVTTGTITSGIDSATFYSGTLCFWTEGASQCYDLSNYFCQSGYNYDTTKILFYNCDGDLVDSLKYPISYVDVDYPLTKRRVVDTTYFGIDQFQGQSGLLLGGVVSHDTLYTYDVTAATYTIGGVQYTSAAGFTTLSAADEDFDRQDIIALDTNGNIVNIPGDPSENPALPQIDPASQLFLTSIYVKAGSTAPDDIVRDIIYDENAENWTHSASGVTDFVNTGNQYHLVYAIDVPAWVSPTAKAITFTSPGKISTATYSILKAFIKLKGTLPSTGYVFFALFNGSTMVTPYTQLTAAHGFSRTDLAYQNITIPFSSMSITGSQYDKVQFYFYGGGPGLYLDYVQLQGGIPNGSSPYITNVFRKAGTDSVFQVINGLNVFAFRDSIGSGGGGGGSDLYAGYGLLKLADSTTLQLDTTLLVNYNFTGLQNHDGLKYDSVNNRWVNFRRIFNSPLSYNYSTNTLSLSGPFDSTLVPDLHSETYYNGKYWKAGGNSFPAGTVIGTLGNTSFRIRANNTEAMMIDSSNRNVGIGNAATSTDKLSITGTMYANSSGGVSYSLDNGSAIRWRSGSTNGYIDVNPGTLNLRATTVFAQAAILGNSSITSGTYIDANIGYGYRVGGQAVVNLKVDSTYTSINNNQTSRKILYMAANNFMNDDINGPGAWYGSGAPSALLELRSTTRGLLLPRMTKTQRDAIVMSGVGGTILAGIGSGSGYTNGNYGAVALTGGTGTGATAKIVVNGGAVTQVSIIAPGSGYVIGDVLSSSSIGGGSGFTYQVGSLSGDKGMAIYQTDNTPGLRVWNGTNWMRFTETAD